MITKHNSNNIITTVRCVKTCAFLQGLSTFHSGKDTLEYKQVKLGDRHVWKEETVGVEGTTGTETVRH